ncbi:MAG: hypothetical protein H6561_01705 [Lewinellaceae bacterium]|nr:hypothetical protein [Lewinellaceae bacterium]
MVVVQYLTIDRGAERSAVGVIDRLDVRFLNGNGNGSGGLLAIFVFNQN